MSAAVITYERIECTLRDGTLVLGKEYKGEHFPKTYASETQAERISDAELKIGVDRMMEVACELAIG